jgi:hypothetical protein
MQFVPTVTPRFGASRDGSVTVTRLADLNYWGCQDGTRVCMATIRTPGGRIIVAEHAFPFRITSEFLIHTAIRKDLLGRPYRYKQTFRKQLILHLKKT